MRHVPEDPTRKDKTTRTTRLLIRRRKDQTLQRVEVVERKDTAWYPLVYTYDELYEPKILTSKSA
jgi:hypothetical protein